MVTVYPNYYKDFVCKAGDCHHSCCIGWEIDIDEDTLDYYAGMEGELGKTLRASISQEGVPHFRLCEGERCPFLTPGGLCELITALGEEGLCEICAEHPRFRNYYTGCAEIGVGLCCEAAAELILGQEEPFSLVNFDLHSANYSAEEAALLQLRSECFAIMQDTTLSLTERHERLLRHGGCALPSRSVAAWCALYLSLERLDERWGEMLTALGETDGDLLAGVQDPALAGAGERLTLYFLYRYAASAEDGAAARDRICLAVQSTRMILALAAQCGESVAECARMYSAEVEYSEENLLCLLSALRE